VARVPYDKDGKFYTTDPRDELDNPERLMERAANAYKFSKVGARLGSAVPVAGTLAGATLGAIGGFILGDQETVFPVDMIAIPAYQAYLLSGTPAFQIYIKEGEVLTQVMPTDASMATEAVSAAPAAPKKRKRKPSAYHKRYSKAFKSLESKYKLKNGKWAKNGFKRCAAAARKEAKGKVKK